MFVFENISCQDLRFMTLSLDDLHSSLLATFLSNGLVLAFIDLAKFVGKRWLIKAMKSTHETLRRSFIDLAKPKKKWDKIGKSISGQMKNFNFNCQLYEMWSFLGLFMSSQDTVDVSGNESYEVMQAITKNTVQSAECTVYHNHQLWRPQPSLPSPPSPPPKRLLLSAAAARFQRLFVLKSATVASLLSTLPGNGDARCVRCFLGTDELFCW